MQQTRIKASSEWNVYEKKISGTEGKWIEKKIWKKKKKYFKMREGEKKKILAFSLSLNRKSKLSGKCFQGS